MELKKTFLAGKMNKDLDQRLLSGGQYSDALNITIDTSEGSNIGSVSNSLGNTLKGNITTILNSYTPAIGSTNARTIGAIEYEALNLIYWFVAADEYDAIFEYNEIDDTIAQVLICTKTGGNPSTLNFNQEYLITGVNYLPGHKDDGALLFWTDNYNPPRKINIARAKQYSVNDSRIDIDIDVILRPPLKSPVIYPSNADDVLSNSMEERFLYFSYRYKYVDNEYSSMSPFSGVAFKPGDYAIDFQAGINKAMVNTYNQCRIVFETGNQFVEEIQLLAYDTRSLNVKVIKSINKDELNLQNDSVSQYVFNNNKIYAPLPADQVTRLFDNVPLLAKSQEIIGNRLLYGNYTQFRNIVDTNDNGIDIDFTVNYVSKSTNETKPIQTFRTDRDYEIGILYGDDYGRMTTALISQNNSVYIPPSVSDKGNSLRVDIKNTPPNWATNYRLVVKQGKKTYYNLFPIWFYSDGAYRYFRINESDRDKFSVGDYVIFKADGNGPTYSNEKYKILEFELKPSGFLGDEETAGLYFKIKVDNTSQFNEDSLPSFGWNGSGDNDIQSYVGIAPRYLNPPIEGEFGIRGDKTYFYGLGTQGAGQGDQNSLTTNLLPIGVSESDTNAGQYLRHDKRYTIEIQDIDPVKYRYTDSLDLSYWLAQDIDISTETIVYWNDYQEAAVELFKINFDPNAAYYKRDQWKINLRAREDDFPYAYPVFSNNANPNPTNYNVCPPGDLNANAAQQDNINNLLNPNSGGVGAIYGGFAVANGGPQAYDSNGYEIDRPIQNGDIITIKIVQDSQNTGGAYTDTQEFFPPGYYPNIEEWFIESGAYKQYIQHNSNGDDVGSLGICFRRARSIPINTDLFTGYNGGGIFGGSQYEAYEQSFSIRRNYPVRMFIPGYPDFDSELGNSNNDKNNTIQIEFNHQQPGVISCETDPLEEDTEIYHEVTDSYDITNNLHKVGWDYADFTDASTVFPTYSWISGLTVLGPLDPTDPQPTDKPHNFSMGQQVYVSGSASVPSINPATGNNYYSIAYIPNQYSVVLDFTFPGSGPSEPGTIFKESWEQDQAANNNGAIIEINDTTSKNSQYNAFSFGNGVESNRIKDDFNAPEMKFSPRVTSIIEDYENERKEASLTYSGVFRGDTSINRLNEFNLSLANFKDLDREFGPIEKLYARDTDVFVLHQDKINKVLYGKNVLFDAVGGGQVASIPEVLGNEMPYPVEYGISNNPESFATNAGNMYFTDSRRGCVIGIERNAVNEISSLGMTDYFRDELKDSPEKQKVGAYDPYSNRYTLSTNNTRRSSPCALTLIPSTTTVSNNSGGLSIFMFNISTALSWAITLVDTGSGTSWVSLSSTSGYGAQNIYANVANNFSGSTRTINFVVTYCSSVTQTFTLTQSVGRPVTVKPIVVNKPYKR